MSFDIGETEMRCECELKPEEIEVLKSIFEIILKFGRSPTIEELQFSLKKPSEEIIHSLGDLEKKGDFLLRKRGSQEIVSVYPLSLTPTKHHITLENGIKLFGMCAVDALGAPIMFNKNAKIVSYCKECEQEITIEIRNEEITFMSHPNMTICSPKTQVYPAAETTCPFVNFFCSKEHADEWIAKNFRLDNVNQRSVKQAFPKIRECWKQNGEMLGIR